MRITWSMTLKFASLSKRLPSKKGISYTLYASLTSLAVACSGTSGGTNGAASTDPPSGGGVDAGTGAVGDAGAVKSAGSDGGKSSGDPFGGADTCGDGIDNDGNGVIDDGCAAASCTLTIKAAFDLPNEHVVSDGNLTPSYVTFNHAAKEIASIGGNDGLVRAYSETDGSLLHTSGSSTALAIDNTDGILTAHGSYLPFLTSSTTNYSFDTSLNPTTITTASIHAGDNAYTYSGGYLYAGYGGATVPQTGDMTFYTYDASLNQTGPMSITFPTYGEFDISDAGGLAIFRQFTQVTVPEAYQEASSALVALNPKGITWTATPITDTWSGYSGMHSTAIVRHENRLLFCQGGAEYPLNSGSEAKDGQMSCHILDTSNGASIANVAQSFPNQPLSTLNAISFGDGFLVTRSDDLEDTAMTLEIDHLAMDGTLTPNVFSSSEGVGSSIERVQELAPDEFGILYTKADQTAHIELIGCK